MALLEVGRIIRPHGLTGEVVVALVTNRLERLEPGTVLQGELDGAVREFEVETARPHQGRFLVRFANVPSRDSAEGLRGTVLRAEAIDDPDELFVHRLIGLELFDQHGQAHGKVTAVEANPASDLLVLEAGLVPLTFVREVTDTTVVADLPTGLLE